MGTLAEKFGMTEANLSLRRQFIRLTEEDVTVLKGLIGWARKVSAPLAKEFYDLQFAFPPTLGFFQAFAATRGLTMEQLRTALETAQAGYFRGIFEEAASGGGGVSRCRTSRGGSGWGRSTT